MATQSPSPKTRPVEDTVSKVNDEVAVGDDLEFQRRWGKAERASWIVLAIFLLLSFLGVFGRGPLAHASYASTASGMSIKYERFQRFGTPSVLFVNLDPSTFHNATAQLWVSDDLVKPLGTQRIVPQPQRSEIAHGGILYTFAASEGPASVEFQTQPAAIGSSHLTLRIPGREPVTLHILVYP
jgi:hypothetical protein